MVVTMKNPSLHFACSLVTLIGETVRGMKRPILRLFFILQRS